MRDNVQRDFDRSAIALRDIVFPALKQSCPAFQGREAVVLLHHRDQLHHDLDTIAGIDAYLRSPLALSTVAARVQYGCGHRTFTIRTARPQHALTELQKRLSQLADHDKGTLYPYWSVHAYLSADGAKLVRVGLAKTSELYFWIAQQLTNWSVQYLGQNTLRGLKAPFEIKESREKEHFLIVPWDTYRASGHYFFEYPSR